MKLVIAPNPILKTNCLPCGPLDVRTVVQAFALLQQHKGLGLAAPQMGIAERWFVTAWGENVGEVKSLERVEIPVTVEHNALLILDILDAEGEVVFTHSEPSSYPIYAYVGDVVKVNNRNIEMIRR